jgi:large subunit ribosomal protein L25
MAVKKLSAWKREDLANSELKSNRKKGNIPGIFYYRGAESVPIYVKDVNLNPFVYTSEVNIINLQIEGGNSYNCILKDIQFDPVSDKPIHFDLLGISEKEKIKLEVPLIVIGAPIGVKDGGILQQPVHKIEVECYPKDIPSHIEINIENLKIGDSIHISDMEQKNFIILDNPNTIVAAVVPPVVEKEHEIPAVEGEAPVEAEAPAEPEVIAQGKKADEGEEEK